MNVENKKLLDEVIKDRLEEALNTIPDDENNTAFKQAMEAVDRQLKLSELEVAREDQSHKQEMAKQAAKRDVIFKIGEILVIPLALAGVQYMCNMRYAKVLCNFEKDYTFTTSAGRATQKFFNFRNKN